MKKIGLITFHFVNNFGGALQAYALSKALYNNCNREVDVINYRNWFILLTDRVRLLPITSNGNEIKSGLCTMKSRIGRIRKMNAFMRKNCRLTKSYMSNGGLKKKMLSYDEYVCGSDQIWNPIITGGFSKAYFLDFVEGNKKKIAYAPSFGSSKSFSFQDKKIKKYLSDFYALSVREYEGTVFLSKLLGREVDQLIDPTFLLSKDEWNEVAAMPAIKAESGKYILLYMMQRDEEVYNYVRKLKEKLNLPIVEISRYGLRNDFVDEVIVDMGPSEFLGLFNEAAYVCTNSYHGLVFSLIYEKDFCLVPCKRFYGRISNLLTMLNIKNSDVMDMNNIEKALYDKEQLREIIDLERKKAIGYLQRNVGM